MPKVSQKPPVIFRDMGKSTCTIQLRFADVPRATDFLSHTLWHVADIDTHWLRRRCRTAQTSSPRQEPLARNVIRSSGDGTTHEKNRQNGDSTPSQLGQRGAGRPAPRREIRTKADRRGGRAPCLQGCRPGALTRRDGLGFHAPGIPRRDGGGMGDRLFLSDLLTGHEPGGAAFPGCRFGGLSSPLDLLGAGKPPEPAGRNACPTGLRFMESGGGNGAAIPANDAALIPSRGTGRQSRFLEASPVARARWPARLPRPSGPAGA